MEVKGEESLAVIDHHAVSFKIQKAGQQDRAVIHRCDGRSSGHAIIESLVLALGYAVEDALRAVDIGSGSVDRGREVAIPFAVRSDASKIILFDLYGLGDLN